MVTHIVLFKLKDRGADSIDVARDVLRSMEGQIPVLRHLEVGTDIGRNSNSFDIALILPGCPGVRGASPSIGTSG